MIHGRMGSIRQEGHHAANESDSQAPGTNNPPRQEWVTYEETEAPIPAPRRCREERVGWECVDEEKGFSGMRTRRR